MKALFAMEAKRLWADLLDACPVVMIPLVP